MVLELSLFNENSHWIVNEQVNENCSKKMLFTLYLSDNLAVVIFSWFLSLNDEKCRLDLVNERRPVLWTIFTQMSEKETHPVNIVKNEEIQEYEPQVFQLS